MRMTFASRAASGLVLLAAPFMPLIAIAQPSFVVSMEEMRATVETVDQQSRAVLLRGPTGGLITVHARPEVRNLSQVKPGDQVVVRYVETVAAEMVRPGTPAPVSTSSAAGAASGERPAGLIVDRVRKRVRIEGIDLTHNTVAFLSSDRVPRTVVVRQPGLQGFLRTLKPGDEVDVTFTEALAVSVEPAAR